MRANSGEADGGGAVQQPGSRRDAGGRGGTRPRGALNPAAVAAMKELGIDLEAAGHYPKVMTPEMVETSARVITMGCDVDASACPANYYVTEDWGLEDPKDKPLEKVRQIRDQIEGRVRQLIEELQNA